MFYLYAVEKRVRVQWATPARHQRQPLGRVLLALRNATAPNPNQDMTDAEVLELRLSEAVLREQPKLERFQSIIRLIVARRPLLGLLGTSAA